MRILLLACGGTIGADSSYELGIAAVHKGSDFINELVDVFPDLKSGSDDGTPGFLVDDILVTTTTCSSDLGESTWVALSELIKKHYDDYDGFLISHGTNTLSYTASALSFAFPNIGKPVVLTGSQMPFKVSGSDALANLSNSLRVLGLAQNQSYLERAAASKSTFNDFAGVFVVFGSQIIAGTRVRKMSELAIEGFASYNAAPVGVLRSDKIFIDFREYDFYREYLNGTAIAKAGKELVVKNSFDGDVLSIVAHPNSSIDKLTHMLNQKFDGILLQGFGDGEMPEEYNDFLQTAAGLEVPVIVGSQVTNGVSSLVLYPGSKRASVRGATPAWDMSLESIYIKLRWLIGQNCSYEEIHNIMPKSLRGEIKPSHLL